MLIWYGQFCIPTVGTDVPLVCRRGFCYTKSKQNFDKKLDCEVCALDFQTIRPPTLKELFMEQLLDMILRGDLKIGDRLPPERQLAEKTRVSRSVVNSGIAELEGCGFLTVKPRSGTYVADYRRNGNLDTLMLVLKYRGGRMRRDEIRSILEVRFALEGLALRQAVPTISDRTVEALRRELEVLQAPADIPQAVEAAYNFQHELALASGNTIVPLVFQSFRDIIYSMWERFCHLYGTEPLYQNNYRMWLYVKERDAEGAVEWLRQTIDECMNGSMQIDY